MEYLDLLTPTHMLIGALMFMCFLMLAFGYSVLKAQERIYQDLSFAARTNTSIVLPTLHGGKRAYRIIPTTEFVDMRKRLETLDPIEWHD